MPGSLPEWPAAEEGDLGLVGGPGLGDPFAERKNERVVALYPDGTQVPQEETQPK